MIPERIKVWIDSADYESLLHKIRTEPVGSPWFAGEIGNYFMAAMTKSRAFATHAERVAASKKIGTDEVFIEVDLGDNTIREIGMGD